jgi:sulfite reductase (ferredoxin)
MDPTPAQPPLPAPAFPCAEPPAEARHARLLGLYGQIQPGLLMQRVKIPGGRLTLVQWRALVALAQRFTPDEPLRVTVRQDLEFHGLRPEAVPALQREIAALGLTTLGACGDTLRNITVCPGCEGVPDLLPLARALSQALAEFPGLFSLPRKFKISFSACPNACGRPYLNDLGFIAQPDGSFHAAAAGSLGAKPGTGILVYDALVPEDVIPLARTALRLFEAEGDRQNRTRARLRHVRERLGDVEFRQRLDALLKEERARSRPPLPKLLPAPRPAPRLRLAVPHGQLAPEFFLPLLDAVSARAGLLSIGFAHELFTYGLEKSELPAAWRTRAEAAAIIACPGAALCQRGVVDTGPLATQLRERLGARDSAAVSGCPNNCAHSAVAEVGFVGCVRKINGQATPCFHVLTGGGCGRTPALAQPAGPPLPAEQALAAALKYLAERPRPAAKPGHAVRAH